MTNEPITNGEEQAQEGASAPAQEEASAPAQDDAYLRLAADFDNYRKRVARDQAALIERANERLVKELLPVLDDLGRALEAASRPEAPVRESGPGEGVRGNRVEVPPTNSAPPQLMEGVQLVHQQLSALLEREGLAEIETNGSFDPHVHEALLSQPSEQDEGMVIEVVQKGYRLGDRVLRPARVVVAAHKESSA